MKAADGFAACSVLRYGPLVQLGERHPVTVEVRGSRPLRIANNLDK
jgi:hypothetical protein